MNPIASRMSTFVTNLEEENLQLMRGKEHDSTLINLKKSDEFVINSRGQTIHVRSYLPNDEPKALIIFCHGYSAHCNRPIYQIFGREFNNKNIGFVTFDFHGHGYSDGVRALLNNYEDLIDDEECVISALYSTDSTISCNLLKRGFTCPYFLGGQSMGGAITMFLSQKYQEKHNDIAALYQGSILLCPAIDVKKPHAAVFFLFEWIMVPLFPDYNLPSMFTNVDQANLSISDPSLVKYIYNDGYPRNSNGLGYSESIRYVTGYSVIKLGEAIRESLHTIQYPFLVIHDPEDQIVRATGTEMLMELSQSKPEDKTYIQIENVRHDLMHNASTAVVTHIIDWVNKRLQL